MAVCGWGSFLPHISTMFSEFPWWRQPRMAHSIVDIYTTGASTRADDSSSWWSMSSQHIVEWSESGTFAASMRRALITVSVTQGHRDGVLPSLSNWMPITFSYTVPDARACLLSPHLLSPLLWEFRFWGIQLFGTRVPTSLPVAVDAPKSEFSRRGEKRWGDNSLVVNVSSANLSHDILDQEGWRQVNAAWGTLSVHFTTNIFITAGTWACISYSWSELAMGNTEISIIMLLY